MARIYLDTSFVSACVTNRTDAASTYRKETSCEWWTSQNGRHEVFVSGEVILELSRPTYPLSTDALRFLRDIPLLDIDERVYAFAEILVAQRVMPGPMRGDAIHLAAATVHRCDYLLSWNVRHLANPNKLAHLTTICLRSRLVAPQIVTPDLLWETSDE